MEKILNTLIVVLLAVICCLLGFIALQERGPKTVRALGPAPAQDAGMAAATAPVPAPAAVPQARVFYIDAAQGSNWSSGKSPDKAWKDFSKLKRTTFEPGDKILLKRGATWHQTLYPPKGGTAEAPIVIDAYGNGPLPVIDAQNTIKYGVRVKTSFLSISRIRVMNTTKSGVAVHVEGGLSHLSFHGMKIKNCSSNGINIREGGSHLTITGCEIENVGNCGIFLSGSPANHLSNVVVKDCYVKLVRTNDGITIHQDDKRKDAGTGFLIQDNTAELCAEQGFDITTGTEVLLLNNRSANNGHGGIMVGHTAREVTIIGHISRNEPTTRMAAAVLLDSYTGNVRLMNSLIEGNGYHLLKVATNQVAIFNNTLVWDGGNSPIDIEGEIEHFYYINNILTTKKVGLGRIRFLEPARPPNHPSFYMDHNIYYAPNQKVTFLHNQKKYPFDRFKNRFYTELNSIMADPGFTASTDHGYGLGADSPALDKAGPLTKISPAGDGDTINVDNPLFFYTNRMTDATQCIDVKGRQFQVLDVDYKTHMVKLDRPVANGQDQVIHPCFESRAPDIGAFERKSAKGN